jgi:hypothetical protein
MFKTSTVIIKGQVPGLTLSHLLNFYKRELHYQNVSHISTTDNTLAFSNKVYKFVINRYANKFSSFSSGQIRIEDSGNEFIIDLRANMNRLFINAAIIAVAATFFFLFGSGFNAFPFIIGATVFTLLAILGYIITSVSFPIYFVTLRNKVQQELEMMNK